MAGPMSRSRQFRLAARPEGEIKDSDFELVTGPVPVPGWMSAARSYIPPVEIGEVMREQTPDRVAVFDNVGGEVLDEGLTRLRRGARVVICGAVSQYNASGRVTGPGNYLALLVSRASMTGFVVFDFANAADW